MKEIILFDLDGTLTDPKEGITKSVQYSLKAFSIHIEDTDELIKFIGPPLRESYKRYYGFSDENSEKAVEKYREYFAEKGIFENGIYDGIGEMLQKLKQGGKRLAVATSKPAVYAEKILEHFGIDGYFDFVAGSELDGTRSKKSEVIRYALDNLGVSSLETALMVGDREHDILGAKEIGVEVIGVLYGYGDFDELTKAGADHIAGSVDELSMLLETL